MPAEQFIFVGFELDAALTERIGACGESDRVFMENPTYLETLDVGDHRYVGKRIEVGVPADRLDDTVRSVISLLARLIPGFSIDPGDARLIAVEEKLPQEI
jgi:hypothetical protein